MFDANNNVPYGQYGYGMPQAPQAEKFYNFLTKEEIDSLQAKKDTFSITPTSYEITRARCNHRRPDGEKDALIVDPATGRVRCSICGYEFMPQEPDLSQEAIVEAKDKIVDLLQTIKLLFIDFNPESAREFYQILPYIEKIPQLYEYAAKNFAKHDVGSTLNQQYNNMGTLSQFQQFMTLMGSGANIGFQQPVFQQQPMMYQQQPAGFAGYPQPAYGAYYQQPVMPQYQPANPGFQYQPVANQAPVQPTVTAPVAPAATDTATVKQTVTV